MRAHPTPLRHRFFAGLLLLTALPFSAGGQTWLDLSANLPEPLAEKQYNAIVSDGTRLYLLARHGVLVSADDGATFSPLNDVAGGGPDLGDLAGDALNMIRFVNGQVWIGGSGVTTTPGTLIDRLHRLTPGESVWQPCGGGLTPQWGSPDDIGFDPVSGLHFLTHSTGEISVSSDGGLTWERRTNGLSGIGSPSSVVAADGAFLTSRPSRVMRSTDQGGSWTTSLPSTWESLGNMVKHQDRVLLWRDMKVDFTDDAGASWKRVPDPLPGVLGGVSKISSDGTILYAVTGGGAHPDSFAYSASGGLVWQPLSRDGIPPASSPAGYYSSGKIVRHGDHLFVHGTMRDNFFQFDSSKLFRLDLSSVTFSNPLRIAIQPEPRGLLVGQSHLLEVYAAGEDLSYQWRKNGEDIPGATSRTLPLDDVTVGSSGDYTVVVSSPGETPVTSAVATVSVFGREAGRWDPLFDQTDIDDGGRVHLLPGGEAIVVKTHSNPLVISRIGPDGGRLQHKSTNTTTANDYSNSLIDQAGRIVAAFKQSSNSNSLQRFDAGSFDFLSTLVLGPNTSSVRVRDMVEVPGRGYAIVGVLANVGSATAKHFALVGYDNVMDPAYAPGAGPDTSSLSRVTCAPDGNVWVCGQGFSTWSGIPASRGLVRIDTAGAIHGVFPDVGSGRANFVHALSDNRVLVLFGASGPRVLYALHPDGTRDTTFNAANHTISDILRVAEQPDGKLILVGDFGEYGGVPAAGYVRLHPDGTVDESFYCATGFSGGTVNDVTYDPRGYIYLSADASSGTTFQGQGPVGGGPVRIFASAEAGSGGSGTTFAGWPALLSLPADQRGADATPAGDGVANLVKYAVGGDPLGNVFDRLPAVGDAWEDDDETYPTVSYIRDTGALGVTVGVEVAADLGFGVDLGSTVVSSEALGDGTVRITVRSNASFASQPKQFFRLRVTED